MKHGSSSNLTQIPLFQAVEAHKNTLDLLEIVQNDTKELKLELEAAYKEIDKLKTTMSRMSGVTYSGN